MEQLEVKIRTLEMLSGQLVEGIKLQAQGITTFATLALRGAFFLNGAAALAVLAKPGGIDSAGLIIVKGGATGALFAVLAAGASYMAQSAFSLFLAKKVGLTMQNFAQDLPLEKGAPRASFLGIALTLVAIVLFGLSINEYYTALTELITFLGGKKL